MYSIDDDPILLSLYVDLFTEISYDEFKESSINPHLARQMDVNRKMCGLCKLHGWKMKTRCTTIKKWHSITRLEVMTRTTTLTIKCLSSSVYYSFFSCLFFFFIILLAMFVCCLDFKCKPNSILSFQHSNAFSPKRLTSVVPEVKNKM